MRWILAASGLAIVTAGAAAPTPARADSEQCGVKAKKKSSLLGGLADAAASVGLSQMGSVGTVGNILLIDLGMRRFLSDAIACALTGKEAEKAVASTNDALNQGVGGESNWKSEERKGVTGKTTVVAENKASGGKLCRTARTIIIVDGEEKSVEQPYCTADGSKWEVAKA